MKIYVVITGILFGLVTIAHGLRMIQERALATDPWYLLLTGAAAAFCLWACRLLWRSRRPS